MIDGSEKRNRLLYFEFQSSHFTEICNKLKNNIKEQILLH